MTDNRQPTPKGPWFKADQAVGWIGSDTTAAQVTGRPVRRTMSTVKFIIVDDRFHEYKDRFAHATPGSAAIDLIALPEKDFFLEPGDAVLVPTGLKVWVENPNLALYLLPRSGKGHRDGLVLGNLTGLIDADYQGELMVSLWNRGKVRREVKVGDAIAQAVLGPVYGINPLFVNSFEDATERGEGGWGHTDAR